MLRYVIRVNTSVSEKIPSRVEITIAADASRMSLFNCEDNMNIAVEVGKAKNSIPTCSDNPVTSNSRRKKKPAAGSANNLMAAASRDGL